MSNAQLIRNEHLRQTFMQIIGRISDVKNCDVCESPFIPATAWQKRCSKKCNSIVSNARRRDNSGVKMCRTCRQNLPVGKYHPSHRSCIECEELHASQRKRCKLCLQVKDFSEFHRKPNREHSYDSRCKACRSAYAKKRNADPEYRARYRELRYQRLYGIKLSEVDEMRVRQQGLCAICGGKPDSPLHVDHDHATGKVRELLCLNCNALLGHCSDSIDVLKKAIDYVERHSR